MYFKFCLKSNFFVSKRLSFKVALCKDWLRNYQTPDVIRSKFAAIKGEEEVFSWFFNKKRIKLRGDF